MSGEISYQPIGIFHSQRADKLEAPRQAVGDASHELSRIELLPGRQLEQALEDLDGFSHVWVLFHFDRNSSWKPKVQPPRGSSVQRGVFATRSPYRPNGIGLSCCEIIAIKGRTLYLKNADLLDGTPILDIKPYVVESDSFAQARQGWIGESTTPHFEIEESSTFSRASRWLTQHGLSTLVSTTKQQLEKAPFDRHSKRVKKISDREGIFAFRTWRVGFSVHEQKITLEKIFSGYTPSDLQNQCDPYNDKELHRQFLSKNDFSRED